MNRDLGPDRPEIMQFFEFTHLPDHLAASSKPFFLLADYVCEKFPPSAERAVVLRRLLEARDAAVRCRLMAERREEDQDES